MTLNKLRGRADFKDLAVLLLNLFRYEVETASDRSVAKRIRQQMEEELAEHEPDSSRDDEFHYSPSVRASSRSRHVRNVTYVNEAEVYAEFEDDLPDDDREARRRYIGDEGNDDFAPSDDEEPLTNLPQSSPNPRRQRKALQQRIMTRPWLGRDRRDSSWGQEACTQHGF